jgi:hypothetical protein
VSYDPLANETGTPPPLTSLPEKEKTREIPDFCTKTINDKGAEEEEEGVAVITPQNFPLLMIMKFSLV